VRPDPSVDKEVSRVLESYRSAVFAKDSAAFMRLYDPNVRVFDAWGVWSYEGQAAWHTAVEGWFTSLATERVRVDFEEVKVSGGSELASLSAMVTYAGVSAEGKALRTMTNRITWVLRTTGHVLRIVHEHTSAPIGFADSKAILQRAAAP
jgi:ketosteroid isomerase-like protein